MNLPNYAHFTTGPLTIEEMFKIVTLLENPPEAEHIRKALKLYTVPTRLHDPKHYGWGDNSNVINWMTHYMNPQNEWELVQMLKLVEGKRSVLEIGSSFGGTLRRIASVMPRGSKVVSVDLDCDTTPKFLNAQASLKEVCRQIGMLGGNVELFIGDSHAASTIAAVKDHAPYDFCFIDGDHSYDGVKQDWENYGPMAKVIAFHDVSASVLPIKNDDDVLGCRRFWQELKDEGKYRTEEYISGEMPLFGIGVVFRDEVG